MPTRSGGWRDRINGGGSDQSSSSSSAPVKNDSQDTDFRRNLNWGQRRTKVYHIDSDIDVHKFKIIDTIHIKRSQIEARLAEFNDNQKRQKVEQNEILMLTYPGFDKLCNQTQTEETLEGKKDAGKTEIADEQKNGDCDPLIDPNLDGLSLKDNTKKKLSQFAKQISDNDDMTKKIKSPPMPKKKKYNASVDWREELKNRDKAKQLEALKNYKIGTPDYKEPEKEAENEEKPKIVDNKWEKSKAKWERIKLKPTNRQESKPKEKESVANDEPFKINLRPVNNGRIKTSKNEEKVDRILRKDDKSEIVNEVNSNKIVSRRNSVQLQEEKSKPSRTKPKRQQQQEATDDKKYVIKVINFVAIKVPVEESPPAPRKRNLERKPSQKKPPIPKTKPPSLPKEDDLQETICNAEVCQTENFNAEVAQMLQNDFDERLKTELLKNILTEIIKDNEMAKASVVKEKVQMCPKPKTPTKPKDEKSFDEKYFKPRRRKIIDYIPEPVTLYKRSDDIDVAPIKFSSSADNYVTKSLFVGSQYVGHKNLK